MRNVTARMVSLVLLSLLLCTIVFSYSLTSRTSVHAVGPHVQAGNWTQYGFTAQHTGFNPYETTVSQLNVSRLKPAWTATTNSFARASQATVANGVVYYASNTQIYAYQATTGTLLWTDTLGGINNSTPIVANGIVYVTPSLTTANLYALDAQTGKILWSKSIGVVSSTNGSPTLANGVIYVGWDNGKFYAFDAKTGNILWSVPLNSIYDAPAIYKGVVYINADIHLYALSASNGKQLWNFDVGGYSYSAPSILNGIVYIAGSSSTSDGIYTQLAALNAATGATIWIDTAKNGVPPSGSPSSLAINNGLLYMYSSEVYAFNTSTEKLVWQTHTGNVGVNASSSPIIANNIVYIGMTNHNVYALNATTGEILWSYAVGGFVSTVPTIANGMLYVGSSDFKLNAFHLD